MTMNSQTLLIPGIAWFIGIIVMFFLTKGHKDRTTWLILTLFFGLLAVIIFLLTQKRSKV